MPDDGPGSIVHRVKYEIDARRSAMALPATYLNQRRACESWSLLRRGKGEYD
jgi:hypothetical protein